MNPRYEAALIFRIGILFCLLVVAGVVAPAYAGENPTGPEDSGLLRTQVKAEELFSRGQYKRSLFIYEKELARAGDKFAQYMTGYMYLMGYGAQSDPVLASAWYRLAAERDAPEFIAVRDQLMKSLSPEDKARSDRLYGALRKDISDVAIVMSLLAIERRRLDENVTGTRLRGSTSSVRMMDPETGRMIDVEVYRNRVEQSIQMRLDFITSTIGLEPLNADLTDRQFGELRDQVSAYLSQIDDSGENYVDNR